jgi:hypothetical protein
MSVLGTEEFLFISIQNSYWVKQNVDKFPYLGIKWQHGEVNHIRLSSDQEENFNSITDMNTSLLCASYRGNFTFTTLHITDATLWLWKWQFSILMLWLTML